jgi:hypothetical protein
MGLLRRRSAFEQMENEIAGLRSRRGVLAGRLARADADIEQALSDRQRQLVETDDDGVEPTHVAQLRDTRDSLSDAISALDLKISEAVVRLDQECDRLQRQTASKELSAAVDQLDRVANEAAAALDRVFPALDSVLSKLPPPPLVLKVNVQSFANAIIEALRAEVAEAQRYITRLTEGDAALVPPRVEEAKPPPAPKVERREVFLLVNGRWAEPDGTVRTAGRHVTCDPPAAIAQLALQHKHALDPLSDHAIMLRQRIPPDYSCYAEQDCIDLAEPPTKPVGTPTATAPVFHSEFNRGHGGFATVSRNAR